jgi:hypothetical protein
MFKFWTHPNVLVARYKPDDETHDLLTGDELVKRGLDFVLNAIDLDSDDSDDKLKTASWLDKALYYFKRAGRADLVKKLLIQRKVVDCLSNAAAYQKILEADKIEDEYNMINLIYESMTHDMHNEALKLMKTRLNDDSGSRFMNDMMKRYETVIRQE